MWIIPSSFTHPMSAGHARQRWWTKAACTDARAANPTGVSLPHRVQRRGYLPPRAAVPQPPPEGRSGRLHVCACSDRAAALPGTQQSCSCTIPAWEQVSRQQLEAIGGHGSPKAHQQRAGSLAGASAFAGVHILCAASICKTQHPPSAADGDTIRPCLADMAVA